MIHEPSARAKGNTPHRAIGVGISFLPEHFKQLAAIAKRRKLTGGRARSTLVREAVEAFYEKEIGKAE